MLHIPFATASDIMQTDLASLHVEAPIQEAIQLFEDYHISGAAVVDGAGEPVGVISETDILRRDIEAERRRRDGRSSETDEEVYRALEPETVGAYMTSRIVAVEPDASFQDICGLLADESIHRVFVVEDRRLKGIITTTDIVRLVAASAKI